MSNFGAILSDPKAAAVVSAGTLLSSAADYLSLIDWSALAAGCAGLLSIAMTVATIVKIINENRVNKLILKEKTLDIEQKEREAQFSILRAKMLGRTPRRETDNAQ